MQSVADANVLLPLLTEGHAHAIPAIQWWDACDDASVGLSLPVHMALLRLLTNARIMGASVLRPTAAWNAVQSLLDDPRIHRIDAVPAGHAAHWQANVARREPTPNLWTDAWLAALAQARDCEMVTFDRGVRSFPKLKLRLLDPAGERSHRPERHRPGPFALQTWWKFDELNHGFDTRLQGNGSDARAG